MIIAFLKYNSVERERKIGEAQKPKEQPVKERAEPRAARDAALDLQSSVAIPEAHLSESLG